MSDDLETMRAERLQQFNMHPTGRAYNKHIEVFGTKPVHYARSNPLADHLREGYLRAIASGVPYDERRGKTKEELARLY
mgnify:CR=1 FL=1|jgi:hypothetical protein